MPTKSHPPFKRLNPISQADEPLLKPDEIAESYWMVAQQPGTAWSWEIDLRPYDEEFFV